VGLRLAHLPHFEDRVASTFQWGIARAFTVPFAQCEYMTAMLAFEKSDEANLMANKQQ
jgi:hypothetical protein